MKNENTRDVLHNIFKMVMGPKDNGADECTVENPAVNTPPKYKKTAVEHVHETLTGLSFLFGLIIPVIVSMGAYIYLGASVVSTVLHAKPSMSVLKIVVTMIVAIMTTSAITAVFFVMGIIIAVLIMGLDKMILISNLKIETKKYEKTKKELVANYSIIKKKLEYLDKQDEEAKKNLGQEVNIHLDRVNAFAQKFGIGSLSGADVGVDIAEIAKRAKAQEADAE